MRVLDLSRPIAPGMPVYPGSERPLFDRAATIERDGFLETRVTLCTHTGTHLDTPGHVLPGGPLLGDLPLERFAGEAVVLDVRGEPVVDAALLAHLLPGTEGCRFLLFRTGWERFWGTDDYFLGFPCFDPGVAGLLATCGVYGLGVDAPSIDPLEASDLPAHRAILGGGLVIVENLAGLAALPGGRFLFAAFPLPLERAEGSPVRAVAILD